MFEWWDGLSSLLKVLYCIAFPASLLLLLQVILSLFGLGHGDGDFNVSDTSGLDLDAGAPGTSDAGALNGFPDPTDASGDIGGDPSMRLFTFQGIVAFFTLFSWTSIVCLQSQVPAALSMVIGFLVGAVALFGVAKFYQWATRLQSNGTISLRNALGQTGVVYIRIPKKGEGQGKITMTVQERFSELDAITYGDEDLKPSTVVRVVDLVNDLLVVEKEN